MDESHVARRVVKVLDQLDLSKLYGKVVSEKFSQGRAAIDPKITLAILLYASIKGLSSSRVIAEHCKWEPGFRWILGSDLRVEYVTISNFRKDLGEDLDNILTQVVTVMIAAEVVDLDEVILDGSKIKANAGRSSFRTEGELARLRGEVSEKIKRLNSVPHKQIQQAALQRKKERIEKGIKQIPEIQQACDATASRQKKGTRAKEAKASSTDPDARSMRFSDGSTGPGYNPQVITIPKSGIIVDVRMTNRRNDSGQLTSMLESFRSRYDRLPKRILGDSHYAVKEDVVKAVKDKVEVYCPASKSRKNSIEKSKKNLAYKRSKEPQELKGWRIQMETEEAKSIRRRRSQTEKVHGWIKSKMSHAQFKMRGLIGVQTEMLLLSIGYNLKRYFNLRPLKIA